MQKRRLGNSDIEIAPLAYGGNVFGWTADEATSFKLLDAFVEAGFNFIDTADTYSSWAPGNAGGESGTMIGKWLQRVGRRDRVIIATKVGSEMGPGRQGLSGTYIRRAVEDSLQRLQTDYIDPYQSNVDDAQTPLEETLKAYDQLIKEGKIRVVGASNYSAERLRMVKKYLDDRGMRILAALDKVARQHSLAPATIALAWLIAQRRSLRPSPVQPASGNCRNWSRPQPSNWTRLPSTC